MVVEFLFFIKTSCVPQMNGSFSKLLSIITQIQMTTRKRQIECVKLSTLPTLYMSVCVTGVSRVYYVSHVTSDEIWVCDSNNIILTDSTGITRHSITDIASENRGIHTVNRSDELIYIDSGHNIIKVSLDNGTVIIPIEKTLPWRPRCVYCTPSTGDLLVGMCNYDTYKGKITCYNSANSTTALAILHIQHIIGRTCTKSRLH
jgi:hypothetical protein